MNFLLCPPGMQVAVEFLPLALRLEIGVLAFFSYLSTHAKGSNPIYDSGLGYETRHSNRVSI